MKAFIKKVSKYGLWYAVALEVWYYLDSIEDKLSSRKIRNYVYKKMDQLEEFCNLYDHHWDYVEPDLEDTKERAVTPCGCIRSSCDECGVRAVCTQLDDLQEQIDF